MMKYRVATKRAARGRLRQPYRQGDLDGLCGVYSAVVMPKACCATTPCGLCAPRSTTTQLVGSSRP